MPNLPLLKPRTPVARLAPLPPSGPSILEGLGLYGMREIEDAVLAGLVTGDPVLLMGMHGCAKTQTAERLAKALGLKFWAYDAAKANFEDLIGFPVPDSLGEDQVRYARTALSIFDKEFILVDEISRASPSMQSKWLEILWARKVMGMKLDALRFVFAAMNPAGDYAGAIPLDRALAARFAWVVAVPEFGQMELDDRRRVMTSRGDEGAPQLRRPEAVAAGVNLPHFLEVATSRFDEIQNERRQLLEDYVMHFTTALQAGRVQVDGRRASMLYRNAAAFLAVREIRTGARLPEPIDGLRPHLWDAMRFSLPFAATDRPVSEGVVLAAHGTAVKALSSKASRRTADASLRVLSPSDPLRAVAAYAEVAVEFGATEHAGFVTRLEDALKARRSPVEFTRNMLALMRLVRLYQDGTVRAPADPTRRALRLLRDTLAIDSFGNVESPEILRECLAKPDDALIYRLAVRAAGVESATKGHGSRTYYRVRQGSFAVTPDILAEIRQEVERLKGQEA